jgi:Fe-S-cluster containining protein
MVFDCKLCGQCCEGEGGIFLLEGEAGRIALFLGKSKDQFIRQCCELRNGRTYIRTSQGGTCLFYDPEKSCTIHPVKPDRCNLWPFFEANLCDPDTFEAAKLACPGIRPDCSHDEFVREWERKCFKK